MNLLWKGAYLDLLITVLAFVLAFLSQEWKFSEFLFHKYVNLDCSTKVSHEKNDLNMTPSSSLISIKQDGLKCWNFGFFHLFIISFYAQNYNKGMNFWKPTISSDLLQWLYVKKSLLDMFFGSFLVHFEKWASTPSFW